MKIFKLSFSLMLLSVFAGFAESTPLQQEKTIEISSLSLKAIFSTLDKGRLEQLIDNYGREYLSPRNNIEPLWIVEACQIGVFTNKCVSTAK